MKLSELGDNSNINCRISKNKDLKILRYEYDLKHLYKTKLEKHLRGLIIDNEDTIVMLPPMKATVISIEEYFNKFKDIEVYPIIDGVMINLFYRDNKWNISTRSYIGGYNKWYKGLNFKDMFDECKNFDYDDLDKRYTFSFVLRHKNNVNISDIKYNEAYLVEIRDQKTLDIIDKKIYTDIFNTIDSIKINNDCVFSTHEIRGYTFYIDNIRYKIVNNLFEHVKELKGENSDKTINILNIRQQNKLSEYLLYFPNDKTLVASINEKLSDLTDNIYMNYVNYKILKNIDRNKIEFHIKPCIDDLHKLYLTSRKKITKVIVKNYINNLSIYKLKFILNYIN